MFKFIFLFLVSFNCFAHDLYIDFNLHAHHFNRTDAAQQHLNEINPGIGLRFVDGDYHKMVGVYKNSYSKTSAYALLAWTPIKIGASNIGAVAGVVTGYLHPYKPAAGLYTSTKVSEKININVTLVPTIRSMQCYGFEGWLRIIWKLASRLIFNLQGSLR
jgi:hypothetical protein